MHLRMYVERGMYACIVPSLNYFPAIKNGFRGGGCISPSALPLLLEYHFNVCLSCSTSNYFFNFSVEACPDLVMLRGPPSANPGSVPVCIGVIVHYGPLRYGV